MSYSLNDGFKKINLIELIIVILFIQMISGMVNAEVWIDETIIPYSIFYFILIVLFFVYKLKDYKAGFKNDLKSFFYDVDLKEVFLYAIMLYFGVQCIVAFFIYLGIFDYLSTTLVVYSPFSLVSNYLIDFIDYPIASFVIRLSTITETILTLLISCIFVPIQNELVLRGVFLNRLNTKVGLGLAIAISSLAYIFVIGEDSVLIGIVLGFFLSFIYLKTKNIFVSMFVLFLYKVFSFIDNEFLVQVSDYSIELVFGLISILLLILLIKYVYDNWEVIRSYND